MYNIFRTLLIIGILVIPDLVFGQNSLNIISVVSNGKIFSEWNNPGLYSPVNAFDANMHTAAVFEIINTQYKPISFEVLFNRTIEVDEIRIANGNQKSSETYSADGRFGKIEIEFITYNGYSVREVYQLKNAINEQSFMISGPAKINGIRIVADIGDKKAFFPGRNNSTVAISELKLYRKGKPYQICGIDESKTKYLNVINMKLNGFFSDKVYRIWDNYGVMKCYQDGRIIIQDNSPYSGGNNINDLPDGWKVRNYKLYTRNKGVWNLRDYLIYNYEDGGYTVRMKIKYNDGREEFLESVYENEIKTKGISQ